MGQYLELDCDDVSGRWTVCDKNTRRKTVWGWELACKRPRHRKRPSEAVMRDCDQLWLVTEDDHWICGGDHGCDALEEQRCQAWSSDEADQNTYQVQSDIFDSCQSICATRWRLSDFSQMSVSVLYNCDLDFCQTHVSEWLARRRLLGSPCQCGCLVPSLSLLAFSKRWGGPRTDRAGTPQPATHTGSASRY